MQRRIHDVPEEGASAPRGERGYLTKLQNISDFLKWTVFNKFAILVQESMRIHLIAHVLFTASADSPTDGIAQKVILFSMLQGIALEDTLTYVVIYP